MALTSEQRLLRVARALVEIAEKKEGRKPRRALNEGKPGTDATDFRQVAPAVNAIGEKISTLSKMLDSLLAAVNRGNKNNVKTLLTTVKKKIQELNKVSDKMLQPLTASTRSKRVDVIKRGNAIVARAEKLLASA